MKAVVEVSGRARQVGAAKAGTGWQITIDGRSWFVDAVRLDAQSLSLLISGATDKASAAASTSDVGSGLSRTDLVSRTRSHDVTVSPSGPQQWTVQVGGAVMTTALGLRRRRGPDGGTAGATGPLTLTAPMPGRVVRVLVAPGDPVRARQPIVVVEAMKMENELRSPRDGVVASVAVKPGQSVDAGTLLAVIAAASV